MGLVNAFFETLHWRTLAGELPTQALATGYLVLTLMLGTFLFHLLDTSFAPKCRAKGIIEGHAYSPQSLTKVNRHDIVSPRIIPASWHVRVRVGKRTEWVQVSKLFYDLWQDGQPVLVDFKKHRFTGNMHVTYMI